MAKEKTKTKKDIRETFELRSQVTLNPDFYIHQIITKILDTPRDDVTTFMLNIDLLESFMLSSDKFAEGEFAKIKTGVNKDMEKLKKSEDWDKLSDKVKISMKYNRKLKRLLDSAFGSQEIEGAVIV